MTVDDFKARQYTSSEHLDVRTALHRRCTPPGEDISDFVWAHYEFASSARILEVGCGTGSFWTHTAARLPQGVRLTLTDNSLGMLVCARARIAQFEPRFASANAVRLPFGDDTFDVALAHFMLYHVPDRHSALLQLKRVVRSEGWVGIVLTNSGNMTRVVEALVDVVPDLRVESRDSSQFSADLADPLIRSVFRAVDRRDYEYTMHVDHPAAVIAYAQSMSSVQAARLSQGQWDRYSDCIATEIRQSGTFRITKRCSSFICRG